MFRVTSMSGKVYALEIFDVHIDAENIQGFVEEGTDVVLVDDLQNLEKFGIDLDEVIVVDGD